MIAARLEVEQLARRFPIHRGIFQRTKAYVHAVDNVSFTIGAAETIALVGESGCGKSTVGRCVVQLDRPDAGAVTLDGHDLAMLARTDPRQVRRQLQIVFQDPSAALTGHLPVGVQLEEPLANLMGVTNRAERRERVADLLARVGLNPSDVERYPHQFSGGQKQRVCIARALAGKPSFLVCDEAVSALDVSIKAQIVNLLIDLQEKEGIGILFISHDLGIVESIAHRVAVMYLGRIVETGTVADIFDSPRHPYTEALLAAAPKLEQSRQRPAGIVGDVPSPAAPPSGCHFRTRCPLATERCMHEAPALTHREGRRLVACHFR